MRLDVLEVEAGVAAVDEWVRMELRWVLPGRWLPCDVEDEVSMLLVGEDEMAVMVVVCGVREEVPALRDGARQTVRLRV